MTLEQLCRDLLTAALREGLVLENPELEQPNPQCRSAGELTRLAALLSINGEETGFHGAFFLARAKIAARAVSYAKKEDYESMKDDFALMDALDQIESLCGISTASAFHERPNEHEA